MGIPFGHIALSCKDANKAMGGWSSLNGDSRGAMTGAGQDHANRTHI